MLVVTVIKDKGGINIEARGDMLNFQDNFILKNNIYYYLRDLVYDYPIELIKIWNKTINVTLRKKKFNGELKYNFNVDINESGNITFNYITGNEKTVDFNFIKFKRELQNLWSHIKFTYYG